MILSHKPLLIVTGLAGSGKDTFANVVHDFADCHSLKFSAPLKDLACTLWGWDRRRIEELDYKEAKLPVPIGDWTTRREVLQKLGTEVFRDIDPDVWVDAALRNATFSHSYNPELEGFISTDCRFPNEYEGLLRSFSNIYAVRLERIGGPTISGSDHSSEGFEFPINEVIQVNDGDLLYLEEAALEVAVDLYGGNR